MNPQLGISSHEVAPAEALPEVIEAQDKELLFPSTGVDRPLVVSATRAIRRRRLRRDSIYRRTLALADAFAAAAAILASLTLARHPGASMLLLLTIPLIVVMNKLAGSYDREDLLVRKTTLDEAPALFQLATLYSLTVWLCGGLVAGGHPHLSELLVLWLGLFFFLLVFRGLGRAISANFAPAERCILIGDTTACTRIAAKLRRRLLADVVVVDVVPTAELQPHDIVRRPDVDRVVVAPGGSDDQSVVELVRVCKMFGLKVSVVPTVLEAVGSSVHLDDLEGMPLLSAAPAGFSRSSRVVKRVVDLLGSAVLLALLAPLLAVIAIAVRLDSSGEVLFRQRRVGCDGKPFRMLKFRTMALHAEELQDDLRPLSEAEGLFKIAEDPRITRVGRLLRRASLDELPQLINVLRGDMSLVGPRPLVPDEDRQIEGWHRRRLHLTPGMTGHWQILGSARVPLEEMVRIDYLYVTNWSLWGDVKILLRTIPYVLARRGL
jgi:exopolysaccharide biosynthesis polyprenyl glycosylphosphotransferase